jgi:WD40 repeat protein
VNERDVFNAAIELADPIERAAYLENACAGNPSLMQHVQRMLQLYPQLGEFLESPAVDWNGTTSSPMRAGRFELGPELARGGMGVVYSARDEALGRNVAVKVLHERYHVDSLVGQRFLDEARITAQLQHPGIPPVFEVGRLDDERPYLAMKLIKGRTLEVLLNERAEPASDRGRFLAVFQQICQAVGYAHSKHILHRDLKPANVMVGAFGEVQVMDWGLAKLLSPDGGPALETAAGTEAPCGTVIQTAREHDSGTLAGSLLGTPAFMAPEQAGGEIARLDERTDVFGLGAILCVILTGEPPYIGKSTEELRLMAIRGTLAPAHARLDQCGADARLVDLCRACLAAEREARPHDAGAVAATVHDYLAGVEERAREAELERTAAAARTAEQRRRRPAMVALLAFSACAALALIIGVFVHNVSLEAALQDAQTNLKKAKDAEEQAHKAEEETTRQVAIAYLREAQARRNSGLMGQRFESLQALKKSATHFRALGQLDEQRLLELRNEMIASLVLTDLVPEQEVSLQAPWTKFYGFHAGFRLYALGDDDGKGGQRWISLRRVSDHQEVARLPGPGVYAHLVKISPDGRCLAAVYHSDDQRHQGQFWVWDLQRGEPVLKANMGLYRGFGFTADSSRLAASLADGTIRLYDMPSAQETAQFPCPHRVERLQFCPDGSKLALMSNYARVTIVSATNGQELAKLEPPAVTEEVAWRGDGRLLAVGCDDHCVYLWDLADLHKPVLSRTLRGHRAPVVDLAFDDTGAVLATSAWDATTRLWDPRTGRQLVATDAGTARWFGGDARVGYAQGSEAFGLWTLAVSRERRSFQGHQGNVWKAQIAGDDRLMVSAGDDGVRFWDLDAPSEGGKEITALHVPGRARAVLLQDDALITAGAGGVRRWPLSTDFSRGGVRRGQPKSIGPKLGGVVAVNESASLSPDGQRLAVVHDRGRALIFDLDRPERLVRLDGQAGLADVAFSPDGKWLASGNWQGLSGVRIWDAGTGKLEHELPWPQSTHVAFSPDGQYLVTGTGVEYQFREVGTWRLVRRLARERAGKLPGFMVFTRRGNVLAVGHSLTLVRLVDPATGSELATLPAAGHPLCFSPDGRRLATLGENSTIDVWDLHLIRQQLAPAGLDWNDAAPEN